jgi:hypothetical protein
MRRALPLALVVTGALLAGGAIVSAWIVIQGVEFVKTFNESQLEVTGSAETVVRSDRVKWTAGYARSVGADELRRGYGLVAADLDAVMGVLTGSGFAAADVSVEPVSVAAIYSDCGVQAATCVRDVVRLELRQSFTINSDRVDDVTALAQDVRPFVDQGLSLQTQALEYYYSGLAAARPELLAAATRDALRRGEAVAQSTGARVGALRSVDSGVFQVTQVNSVDVASYGSYDTSTIQKKITAVVHARFALLP